MTDPLTDAVRRLKELQEDVERLKAGRDEEGEPRVYISERDRSTATDEQHVRANDVEAVDVATARDEQRDLRLQREHEPATWNSAGWNTSGYND